MEVLMYDCILYVDKIFNKKVTYIDVVYILYILYIIYNM